MLQEKAKEYNLPMNLCFGDWRKLDGDRIEKIINWLWKGQTAPIRNSINGQHAAKAKISNGAGSRAQQLIKCVQNAKEQFKKLG